MERRPDDGLLEGIEDDLPGGPPAAFIAAVLLVEFAVVIATVLWRLGFF